MTQTIVQFLPDQAATERLGELLATVLTRGDFVGLEGELGAGKTCVTRGILRALTGGTARVTSPTYTLLNEYDGPDHMPVVVHADLYRLHDEDDLESTGYWDAVADADLLIVEWIDQVTAAWPETGWRIQLQHVEAGRSVTVSWVGEGAPERTKALSGLLEEG